MSLEAKVLTTIVEGVSMQRASSSAPFVLNKKTMTDQPRRNGSDLSTVLLETGAIEDVELQAPCEE